MKIEVNGNWYEVEITGNQAIVNGKPLDLKFNEQEIVLNGKEFSLDFLEEGEPSLMIVNGVSYLISKSKSEDLSVKELRAPIGGQIVDVFIKEGHDVKKGDLLLILEAMKMENQMKSPVSGRIKQIKVKKGQLAKSGEVLLTFE